MQENNPYIICEYERVTIGLCVRAFFLLFPFDSLIVDKNTEVADEERQRRRII